MNALGGVGGSVGGQAMMSAGTPRTLPGSTDIDFRTLFHTYLYDYLLRQEYYDIARLLLDRVEIRHKGKQSPDRKNEVNGDTMDEDFKDYMPGRPADLPLPITSTTPSDSSFLFDWWAQFWDCYHAHRNRGTDSAKQYINHIQQQSRMASERQRMMVIPQMQNNLGFRMNPNGMGMPNDIKKAAMQGNRQFSAQQQQQMQQMQQQQNRMQQQMMAQNQMQREGSSIDINGQPRPQTPGSGEQPSPKRQRLNEGFNVQMGPMGRGQPQNMQGQQFNGLQISTPQAKSMNVYAQTMRQHAQNAMESDSQKGMQGANGFPQGSPAMEANGEFLNNPQMRGMPPGAPPGANNNSNMALQDYQMQLMLLEQQNKKRLLMARQEQDSVTNGQPGQPGFVAPAMSPSNSRTGPSPNPEDQMKRGTPKMAPGGIPLNPDGSMPQGSRGSPAPGQFDPSHMQPGMAPNVYQQMRMPNMMGPNGHMMPATSHPAFNGQMNGQMTAQQMEMMRQQGRPPNGPWQGPPAGMMGGGQAQQAPNMTPQQRNAAMPPPPAPAQGEGSAQRTQPSSPSQSTAAPPTPSQANKPNPKAKKDAPKNSKAPAKKGGATTGATPASEAGEQPPTPTPGPPITPTAPQNFNKSTGSQGASAQQPTTQNAMSGQGPQTDPMLASFVAIDNNEMPDFTYANLEGTDVLDNFDFESFLNNDATDASFALDTSTFNFGPDSGLEAGGDL